VTRVLWVASSMVLAAATCFAVAVALIVDVWAGLALAGVELLGVAYSVAYLDAKGKGGRP
jgi:hypothetical protein